MQARDLNPSTVVFEDPLVIVGGGNVDLELLQELYASGGHLAGADGGADRIVAAGLKPDLIVGDFDSLKDPFSWLGKTRLMQLSEQETTDFEKALYSTRAPVTIAMGMTGQRFDHTLAALDALARYGADRRIILVDTDDIAVTLSGTFSFTVAFGERVSVHPLAPITFESSFGLKYPLGQVTLAPGVRTGTSNSAPTGNFTIRPQPEPAVPYLLIISRAYLLPLVAQLLAASRG